MMSYFLQFLLQSVIHSTFVLVSFAVCHFSSVVLKSVLRCEPQADSRPLFGNNVVPKWPRKQEQPVLVGNIISVPRDIGHLL